MFEYNMNYDFDNTYPIDYDWLPESLQNDILNWFAFHRDEYRRITESEINMIMNIENEHVKAHLDRRTKKLLSEEYNRIVHVYSFLRSIGIYVNYDQYGHRGDFFLETARDVEIQEDFEYDCVNE